MLHVTLVRTPETLGVARLPRSAESPDIELSALFAASQAAGATRDMLT